MVSWYQHGKLHRVGGPAHIQNGAQYWYQNDKYHRVDGPAIIWPDGSREWWLFGKQYKHNGAPNSFIAAAETLTALFPDIE